VARIRGDPALPGEAADFNHCQSCQLCLSVEISLAATLLKFCGAALVPYARSGTMSKLSKLSSPDKKLLEVAAMTETNHPYWGRQFEAFFVEFSRLSAACDIDIFQAGVGDRVLNNDESVCGRRNPAVFKKLRRALMAFYEIEEKAIERIGPEEVLLMLDQLRASTAKLHSVELGSASPAPDSDDQGSS
jgi:hypothetical protein